MSQTTTTIREEELIQFSLNNTLVSMRLEYVERINLQEKIIPIPRSPPQIVGVTKIENNIIPIINLEKFLETKEVTKQNNGNRVLIVTTISDATFALQSSTVPKVFRGELTDVKKGKKFSFIPEKWIESIVTDANNNELPVLNPNEFWVGLASDGLAGLGITEVDIDSSSTKSKSDNGKDTKDKKSKKEEPPAKEIEEAKKDTKPVEEEKKNTKNEEKPSKKDEKPDQEEKAKSESAEVVPEEKPKKTRKRRKKKTDDGADSQDEEEEEEEDTEE